MPPISDLTARSAAPASRMIRLSSDTYRSGLAASGVIRRAPREVPASGPHQGRRPPPQ